MSSPHLLRPFPARQLGLIEGDDGVVVFGVLGGRRRGPTILVHSPTLLLRLAQLADDAERAVFVAGSPPAAATLATIDDMLVAMGPEDGLVQYQMAGEALKLTRGSGGGASGGRPLPIIGRGVDRATVVAFRPPEILRVKALVAAVASPPSEMWVDPAGLVVAHGGRIEIYPRTPPAGSLRSGRGGT